MNYKSIKSFCRRGNFGCFPRLIETIGAATIVTRPAVVFALVLLATGCNRPSVVQTDDGELVLGDHSETSSIQRGVTIGARILTIESETGGVTITGTNSEEATLRFTITGRGDSQQAAKAQVDKLVIEESGDDQNFRYNVIPDKADLTVINIDGQIPRNASLRLVLRNGDVTLTNVEGRIEVEQENGSIVFLGGSESVELTTHNGAIFADFYRLGSGSRVEMYASNGDLSLGLPETASTTIDARTRAGIVSVHDLNFVDRRLARKGAGAVFRAKLGAGTAQAFLSTSNGSITFNRVNLSALPNGEPATPLIETDTTLQDMMPSDSLEMEKSSVDTTRLGAKHTDANTQDTPVDSLSS